LFLLQNDDVPQVFELIFMPLKWVQGFKSRLGIEIKIADVIHRNLDEGYIKWTSGLSTRLFFPSLWKLEGTYNKIRTREGFRVQEDSGTKKVNANPGL
jgi:hypothetical protein